MIRYNSGNDKSVIMWKSHFFSIFRSEDYWQCHWTNDLVVMRSFFSYFIFLLLESPQQRFLLRWHWFQVKLYRIYQVLFYSTQDENPSLKTNEDNILRSIFLFISLRYNIHLYHVPCLCKKRQYFLDVRILKGYFIGEGYLRYSLPWMAARTLMGEVFNGEVCASG